LQKPNQFRCTHVLGASPGDEVGVVVAVAVVVAGADVIECGTVVCEAVVVSS
jgi:hypothetical protein